MKFHPEHDILNFDINQKTGSLTVPFTAYLKILITAAFLLASGMNGQARAETGTIDILPAKSHKVQGMSLDETLETHPPLRLTPDKSELIRLGDDAGSIIVGNPSHLNIMADSARTLIVVPRIPGASYFTVLNKSGDVIMQRHVIVGSPKQKYVRVRRTCYGDYNVSDGCRPTKTYYCPDICHEVNTEYEEVTSSAALSSSESVNSDMTLEDMNEETSEEESEE